MKNIILLAPQAAGKGTQATRLKEKYNMVHISTGDMLREAATKKDELGIKIDKLISNGLFVPDELIFQLIEKKIQEKECANGYILDGFPRNIEQAIKYDEILSKYHQELGNVILIDVSRDEVIKRISGRRICPKCKKNYNINFADQKPKHNNVCDECHIELEQRKDDNKEAIELRLNTYYEKTKPVIKYYDDKNALYIVNGLGTPEEVFTRIDKIVGDSND